MGVVGLGVPAGFGHGDGRPGHSLVGCESRLDADAVDLGGRDNRHEPPPLCRVTKILRVAAITTARHCRVVRRRGEETVGTTVCCDEQGEKEAAA